MSTEFSYHDYVTDKNFTEMYGKYQQRYINEPKESDKVIINLLSNLISDDSNVKVLDVGCSTGNLLLHIRKAMPQLTLMGGDMMAPIIQANKTNPMLAGIEFDVIDMLDINPVNSFDVIITNAVSYMFNYEQYEQAVASVAKALKPNGYHIAYEWFHPFRQDLEILETSASHPDGLKIYARPFARVNEILAKNGFTNVEFKPFFIPIDLEKGVTYMDNEDGFEDLNTYTIKNEIGERMMFRGALYQPWCHLVAQKA